MVKQIIPSKDTAVSLLSRAKVFLKMCESAQLSDEIASPILVNAYEAAREAGQSLMARKGYKPYSHEAVISFLLEKVKVLDSALITDLDSLRILRNKVVYEAAEIHKDRASQAINLAKEIIKNVEEIKEDI